jgi:hypothetical protein
MRLFAKECMPEWIKMRSQISQPGPLLTVGAT